MKIRGVPGVIMSAARRSPCVRFSLRSIRPPGAHSDAACINAGRQAYRIYEYAQNGRWAPNIQGL